MPGSGKPLRLVRIERGTALASAGPWPSSTPRGPRPPACSTKWCGATLHARNPAGLARDHGVLAPNARWRRAVVPPPAEEETGGAPLASAGRASAPASEVAALRRRQRPKYRAWGELRRRAFDADVLACPRCGGRMILIATIEDPAVITRILTHLGLSRDSGAPDRARPPPDIDGAEGNCPRKRRPLSRGRHRRRPAAAAIRPLHSLGPGLTRHLLTPPWLRNTPRASWGVWGKPEPVNTK